jgi:hypothetical protein
MDDLPSAYDNDTGQLEKISAHAQFLRETMVTEFVDLPRAYVTMQDHRGWTPPHTVGYSDRRYTKQADFYDAKECGQDGTPRLYRGLGLAAAEGMLDESRSATARQDANQYTLGNTGEHKVVIACLPSDVYWASSAPVVTCNRAFRRSDSA